MHFKNVFNLQLVPSTKLRKAYRYHTKLSAPETLNNFALSPQLNTLFNSSKTTYRFVTKRFKTPLIFLFFFNPVLNKHKHQQKKKKKNRTGASNCAHLCQPGLKFMFVSEHSTTVVLTNVRTCAPIQTDGNALNLIKKTLYNLYIQYI